ncbi:MAG: lysozyme inhibitor LprI family protein, partial [Burkholderiales bacterium]|nr:lysozyme inhibitor LprI family protein [Burkholderiales bacterium]
VLDTIKILSILHPSKYPTSRFRTELEKEDLEQTYEEIEHKVSNKAALEADQQAWEKKRDEFCSCVYDSIYGGAAYYQEEECKNIMSRIRIKELESMIENH